MRARRRHLRVKRWLDVVVSAAALVVLLPLFAIVALLIRLDSPGPVFFRQTRIGRGGRPFEMWKFRTMVRESKTTFATAGERGIPAVLVPGGNPNVQAELRELADEFLTRIMIEGAT